MLVLTLPVVFVLLFLFDNSSKIDCCCYQVYLASVIKKVSGRDGSGKVDGEGEVGANKADVMRVLRKLEASQVFVS